MAKHIQSKEEAIESVIMGNKNDYHKIFSFAETWVKKQFKAFSSDDLKEAYYAGGGLVPGEPKVFGGVFSSLARAKLIFHHGFTKSRYKCAHGRDLKLWISLEFKERQKNNARNKSTLEIEF